MKRSRRKHWMLTVIALLVVSVILVLVIPIQNNTSLRSSSLPDPPRYTLRGPHPVGTRDLLIPGEPKPEVTAWYPALHNDSKEDAISYPYQIELGGKMGVVTIATTRGQAKRGTEYDSSAGPYPLVILSSAFSIGRTNYAWLAEHLASYGFFVIAARQQEGLFRAEREFWKANITRPQGIHALLAYVEEQVSSGGPLEGIINPDLVAVVGHSLGGYTALAVAGARFDSSAARTHCETAVAANDPSAWLCDMLLPYVADMAELAGLDSAPDGLWPTWGDPRIDAVVSMAGGAYFFGPSGLAKITVPILAFGGTADTETPYRWGPHPTYEHVSSPKRVRAGLVDAEHMIFTGTCDRISRLNSMLFQSFCSDATWDRQRAHQVINHVTTAFLLAELTQDPEAAAALAPDSVNFRGVTFDSVGY